MSEFFVYFCLKNLQNKKKGPFINDFTQLWGRKLCDFVMKSMQMQFKHPFYHDRGGGGQYQTEHKGITVTMSYFSSTLFH